MAAERFADTVFMTAKDKELVLKQFRSFITGMAEDMPRVELYKRFTNRLYKHLYLHCGFIAHHNRQGFFTTYFCGGQESLKSFMRAFLPGPQDVLSALGRKGYEDINGAMASVLRERHDAIFGK